MCIASSLSSVVEDGLVRDAGRISVAPEAQRQWAADLRADGQVALEATGNSYAIANLLVPLVGRVVVSNPSKARAIAQGEGEDRPVDRTSEVVFRGIWSGGRAGR